jgi:hypothetical protein
MRADAAHAPHKAGDSLGWARITVRDHGDAHTGRAPVFEGAFSVRGVTHHVTTRDNYLRNRGALDPPLHPHAPSAQSSSSGRVDSDEALVIWRDSDYMDKLEERAARELRRSWSPSDLEPDIGIDIEPARCALDSLPWNSDPLSNPVLQHSSNPDLRYGPLGLMGGVGQLGELLKKRDDIAGSGSTTK